MPSIITNIPTGKSGTDFFAALYVELWAKNVEKVSKQLGWHGPNQGSSNLLYTELERTEPR
ncbi:hypothetical protein HKT52_07285 [Pseudomonas aeruginosa]|nr:hypothetical protein [Pseudomonas aeruginosa]